MSKYCVACALEEEKLRKKITDAAFRIWKSRHKENSKKKKADGSSGAMEAEGAVRLSKIRRQEVVGDGDSSAYNAVKALNGSNGPYMDVQVHKSECINHVQKRMSTRLGKLRDEKKM